MQSQGEWSAVQGTAMLTLLRLCAFFCGDTPFSAAYAKQMLLTAVLQTVLILPMLHFRHRLQFPPVMLRCFRLCAAVEAAHLTLLFGRLEKKLGFFR